MNGGRGRKSKRVDSTRMNGTNGKHFDYLFYDFTARN